jgi:hypothetical protein
MELTRLKRDLRYVGGYCNDALELLDALDVVREKADDLEQSIRQGASLSESDAFQFTRESAEHLLRAMVQNVQGVLGIESVLEILLVTVGYERIAGYLKEWKVNDDVRRANDDLGDLDAHPIF